MHKFTKFSFQNNAHEYELSLGWDEESLINGSIEFILNAKMWHINETQIVLEVPATIGLYQEEDSAFIKVEILVRSGLSSTIGAILSCMNKISSISWRGVRLLAIGRCLRINVSSFVTKLGLRAIKCMATFGM